LGLAAPKWFMELYIALLGNRQAENALLRYKKLINLQ
jgi:hypothetical protein